MLSFLPLINSSVATELSLLILIISAIISSNTIHTLRFFQTCILQYFHKRLVYHLSIQQKLQDHDNALSLLFHFG